MHEHQFRGTRRFQLRRPLGFGGMGVVYQAYDREREIDVALKVLMGVEPQAIQALKREFRALTDVSHPNLIGFFDLVHDEGTWFITMELVDGVDLIAHLRGARTSAAPTPTRRIALASDITRPATSPAPMLSRPAASTVEQAVDLGVLRALFRQLVRAVSAVHGLGRLHCDLKPSNALVSREDRVVLLDFGLVSEMRPRAGGADAASPMAGTPSYVAPEQWRGEKTTAASDWYSVGVMLFEALTGRLPFDGGIAEVQSAKDRGDFDRGALAGGHVPDDLAGLCQALLAPRPTDRPTASEIAAVLEGTEDAEPLTPPGERQPEPFVGRIRDLELLGRAQRRCQTGHGITVRVEGPSGIGKTALAKTFLTGLQDQAGTLVLEGRCYERESIPFKALDTIVEGLSAHLARVELPNAVLAPEEASALVRLFPVLRQVPGLVSPEAAEVDPQEPLRLRQMAAEGLRALLVELCRRQSVVICIDDAQWGDTDSAHLLSEVLASPEAPPLLLLLVHRNEGADPGAFLAGLKAGQRPESVVLPLALAPLSEAESVQLATALLSDPGEGRSATDIAREAKGNPFFLTELTRFCVERAAPANGAIIAVSLEEVLRRRFSTLPRAARRLLEVIAVAGKPITKRLAELAAGLEPAEATSLGVLRSTHFVRTFGPAESDAVETFHDRVRETLVAFLEPEVRLEHHRRLAETAEAELQRQPVGGEASAEQLLADFLAEHFRAAGIPNKALRYSLVAARRARALYALHDSVRHWDIAVSLIDDGMSVAPPEEREIRREQADALRNAGLFERAIDALEMSRSRAPDPSAQASIRVELGRVFQEMGRPHDAVRELEGALALLGRPVPRSGLRLLASGVVAIVVRMLRPSGPGRKQPPSERTKRQLMALLVLQRIYYFVDRHKLGWGIVTSLNLVRGIDDPVHRARAECYHVAGLLGLGALKQAKAASRHASARVDMAEGLADALTHGHAAMCALWSNDLVPARLLLRESVDGLERAGEYWELQTWLHQEAIAAFMNGNLFSAEQLWVRLGDKARAVHSPPHQAWAQGWLAYCRYLAGMLDAAATFAEVEQSRILSSKVGDFAHQTVSRMHAAVIAVRAGLPDEAAGLALETFSCISRYHVQVPFVQRALVDAAEAALYALERGVADGQQRTALERVARRGYRRALRLGRTFSYLKGPALRVKARHLALTRGPAAAEPLFRQAIDTLAATPNRLELVVALHDAAAAIPSLRPSALPRARALAKEIGAKVELQRLAKIDG